MATVYTTVDAHNVAPLHFNTSHTGILADGKPFLFKGLTWRGAEMPAMVPLGLSSHSIDHYLNFMQREGFNSIRLTFDHEHVLKNAIVPEAIAETKLAHASELIELPYTHIFAEIAKAAARRGILIVLACGRISPSLAPGAQGSGSWYSDSISEDLVLRSWQRMAKTTCALWNVVGVDLMDKPYKSSWGSGEPATDWQSAAARIGNHVLRLCPRWLVFAQGVGANPGAGPLGADGLGLENPLEIGFFMGENLIGAKRQPIALEIPSRLVYAPTSFGPSTYPFDFFAFGKFPQNMPDVWKIKFGAIHDELAVMKHCLWHGRVGKIE